MSKKRRARLTDLGRLGPRLTVIPRLLRRTEAAGYLGLSPSAFDLLRHRGEITAVPVPSDRSPDGWSRTPLFDREDLDRAVERWKNDHA